MSNLNKVMLIGRLGKDPDMRHFDSGTIQATFPLATTDYSNRDGEKVEHTDWHNIVLWGQKAEVAEKYLRKGKLVYIEGKIKTRSWDDQNGNKRYITEIIGFSLQMLGGRDEGAYVQSNAPATQQVKDSSSPAPVAVDTSNNKNEGGFEDDLPF